MSASLIALVLSGCASQNSAGGGPPSHGTRQYGAHRNALFGQFQHVVVIVEENRTVDNMFNGFPGADTVTTGSRNGQTVALQQVALQPSFTLGLGHGHPDFVSDYNNGKLDGFDHAVPSSSGTAYAYVRQSDVQNYWTLATRFTLADEVFQANQGPSFANHISIIAAQNGYPQALAGNATGGNNAAPGCFGKSKVQYIDMRTAFPGKATTGPACIDLATVFDLLDQQGLSWRYYAPNYGMARHFWTGPDYISHLAFGQDQNNLTSPETTILSDIAQGSLPAVSYVIPEVCTSDHPYPEKSNPLGGPLWVASITNAIGASNYWQNTLILVTWDDWGGWYDHVSPPINNADQLGFRTPLLIVSAYPAAAGTPDHTIRNQASIITAIESTFGLGSLGQLDSQTDDLSADFNFSAPVSYGSPLPSATPPPVSTCTASYGGPPLEQE